ncbi:MAG: uracil-DNA glycosylase [Candidatus Saccharibacteria bacterium]|nr:uracil-DNA glycosylase [Candidatus Saccharibacteria bacterium]
MHESWKPILQNEFEQDYFKQLSAFLSKSYSEKTIYPPKQQVFSAFTTDLNEVKVVIIGQDPYHGPGQAHGLAFSVRDGIQLPPSLRNIFKEINAETGTEIPNSGNLRRWSEQGVLLLNNVLTVEAHMAGSHRGKGWETFTEHIIKYLNEHCDHLVFLLWGRDARDKKAFIDSNKHLVLESAHPSPLSAHNGFFGNNHFVKCNEQLKKWNKQEINW